MTAEPLRSDRRQRRRAETIAQVVDVAVEVMAEQGAGGLSLGEVARRMGIRTPSLYVYFPSKNALYDAVFARGWSELHRATQHHLDAVDDVPDLAAAVGGFAQDFVAWLLAHPSFAQLMIWRPVPGYSPATEAYAPALQLVAQAEAAFLRFAERGLLRADACPAEALRAWMSITAGVATQQLANAPDDDGFTRLLPELADMFAGHYGPAHPEEAP